MRKLGLDITFRNPALAPPPRHVTLLLPPLFSPGPASLGESLSGSFSLDYYPTLQQFHYPPSAVNGPCPTAPRGSHPAEIASVSITKPPLAGTYRTHGKGTISGTYDTFKFTIPYPPSSTFTIGKVKTTGQKGAQTISYEVSSNVAGITTVTDYQATPTTASAAGQLQLVKQVTKSSSGTSTFQPATPVELMEFGGVNASWNSAGADPNTGTTMIVSGKIAAEQVVDVCGTLYDSYEVVSTEQTSNVLTGYSSQTNPNDPNVYNVATQFGGLMLRQHIDESVVEQTLNATENYTSTLSSVTPLPSQGSS
ncbi:MAG TPA: hypothetical protein VE990_01335 [Acidimicrobiales bacterium]|nr:hypothetical protein [Acidimicrobiales bacterium]